jgi:hypothetical protein
VSYTVAFTLDSARLNNAKSWGAQTSEPGAQRLHSGVPSFRCRNPMCTLVPAVRSSPNSVVRGEVDHALTNWNPGMFGDGSWGECAPVVSGAAENVRWAVLTGSDLIENGV